MKTIFTMLTIAIITATAQAQTKPGTISGTISNATNQPVDAATIQLLNAADKKLIKTAITNKAGVFAFDKIAEGKYIISISALGFEKKQTTAVEITAANTTIALPAVQLIAAAKGLSAVTVVSNRPFIEQKPDRTVVNVEASPSNAGATALEVLEKSPGVTVDNDGNISLKGKQGVIVMMDGKPTYLSGADLANILRNLPASSLDQIEIMTNPSSKYDASGNSGLINITTKKSKAKGSNGSIAVGTTNSLFRKNGSEEMTWKPSVSVNYNYKKNAVNFFTNAVYNYREGRGALDIISRYTRDNKPIDSINYVNTYFRFRNNNYTLKTGLDFTPNKRNAFGIVLNGFLFAGRPTPTTNTTYTNLAGVPFSRLDTKVRNKLSWNNVGANFNYRHSFDTTGTELTLDLDYGHYNNTSDQVLSTGFFDGDYNKTSDSMYLNGHLPSAIDIYSLKSDFVHTYKNGIKLEAGIKSSYVTSDNLVEYQRKMGNTWVPDSRNNHFVYEENINAAYINANKQFKKWNVQTGLRAEHTNTLGVQQIDNSSVRRNYVSFFPTAYVSYTVSDKNTITASAGRRLQRPNYQDLNPFTFFLDSLSYRQGNPYLKPQFSYNYELTHTYNSKITTTLNYTNTTDVISQIINRKKGNSGEIIGFLTSDNIAKYDNFGIAISAPVKFSKWWNSNLYGNAYRNHYMGTYISNETGKAEVVPLDLAFTSFTININNNFTIGKGWSAEVSGWYRYKTIEQLSLSFPMGQLNFGLAKNNLLKGKGSLRINARDPFNFQRYHGLTKYGTVDIDIRNRFDNRQYGVNFTYRFGKQQGQTRRRSATEEEQQRVGAGS